MRLLRSRKFYIKTEQASGTPYDFSFNVPSGVLQCEDGEVMRISLLQWNLYVSWSNIYEGVNRLHIGNVAIQLPAGNYTLRQLTTTLQRLYDGAKLAADPTLTVEYLSTTNRIQFQFSAASTLSFDDDSWRVLGFASGAPVATDASFKIASTTAIKPRTVDSLILGVRDVVPRAYAFQNDTGEMLPVSYLAKVAITSPPFGLNVWRSLVDGDASVHVSNKDIHSLRFRIYENTGGALATFIPHSTLTVRVDIYEEDELAPQRDALNQMTDYMRLLFVGQNMGAS